MTPEFQPFPKIGRWANNKLAVTETLKSYSKAPFDPNPKGQG